MRYVLCTLVLLLPVAVGMPAPDLCSGKSSAYVLELIAENPGESVSFKGAVGYDGQLRLIEATTPQQVEFRASRIVAIFAAKQAAETLRATLYGLNADGSREKLGHIADDATLILENINCPEVPRSFGSF